MTHDVVYRVTCDGCGLLGTYLQVVDAIGAAWLDSGQIWIESRRVALRWNLSGWHAGRLEDGGRTVMLHFRETTP